MKEKKFRLTFSEPVLGTSAANEDLYREYIASKAQDTDREDEEVEAISCDEEKRGFTIFPKLDDGTPILWDYQVRGFFKAAAQANRKIPGSKTAGLKAFKKEIDTLIFVKERRIPFQFDSELGLCQRPLRASTPQGERVSLVMSEEVPAGATVEFTVQCLVDGDMDLVEEWLDYGQYSGIGQWRNSGKGRFTYEEVQA